MVEERCNFIQSIDSHKSKKQVGVEYERCARRRPIDTYEAIDQGPEHKELQQEALQWYSQGTSSSNTRTRALKLDTVVVEYMKKRLAEFEQLWSTTGEDLPDGSGKGTIVEFANREFWISSRSHCTKECTKRKHNRPTQKSDTKIPRYYVRSAPRPKIRISTALLHTKILLAIQYEAQALVRPKSRFLQDTTYCSTGLTESLNR